MSKIVTHSEQNLVQGVERAAKDLQAEEEGKRETLNIGGTNVPIDEPPEIHLEEVKSIDDRVVGICHGHSLYNEVWDDLDHEYEGEVDTEKTFIDSPLGPSSEKDC